MMRLLSLVVALWAGIVGTAAGQPARPSTAPPATPATVDVSRVGPQPGARVPEFSLPDQDGQPRTLASVAGPSGTLLVFSRSADW